MIEKTLDVTELPVAETVKDGDQLLLVRTQKNGVKVPMRMKAKKQKKQQIVIGRAIRPRACEIGGVENWYVFGRTPWHKSLLLLNISSMLYYDFEKPNLGYDMVVLNITHQKTGNVYVFKLEVFQSDHESFFKTCWADDSTSQTIGWQEVFLANPDVANAFRVDSYDLTTRVLTLNLTHKCLQTVDLHGTSTHHYFKDGVRRWHLNKSGIARRAFSAISFYTWVGHHVQTLDSSSDVVNNRFILLKKEEARHQHVSTELSSMYRSYGYVVLYSKVQYKPGLPSCQINYSTSKRRPYGKYMIWALHYWFPRRKSDEYLHCRMKCVGLGERKKVSSGPRFDSYRVTVREI